MPAVHFYRRNAEDSTEQSSNDTSLEVNQPSVSNASQERNKISGGCEVNVSVVGGASESSDNGRVSVAMAPERSHVVDLDESPSTLREVTV